MCFFGYPDHCGVFGNSTIIRTENFVSVFFYLVSCIKIMFWSSLRNLTLKIWEKKHKNERIVTSCEIFFEKFKYSKPIKICVFSIKITSRKKLFSLVSAVNIKLFKNVCPFLYVFFLRNLQNYILKDDQRIRCDFLHAQRPIKWHTINVQNFPLFHIVAKW